MSILDSSTEGRTSTDYWNYSDPNKPGFTQAITGTIVQADVVQATVFKTNEPDWWPDGNPKQKFVFTLLGQSGRELLWSCNPVGEAANALKNAFAITNENWRAALTKMLGSVVTISTWENGQQGCPVWQKGLNSGSFKRPWQVILNGQNQSAKTRGVNDLTVGLTKPVEPAAVVPPQYVQMQQVPQATLPQPYVAPQDFAPVYPQVAQPQAQPQVVQQQVPVQQIQQVPVQQQPQVVQQAQQVQPVQQYEPYVLDEDIPF